MQADTGPLRMFAMSACIGVLYVGQTQTLDGARKNACRIKYLAHSLLINNDV